MDIEKITMIIDGYIEELGNELGRYSQEMVASAEGVEEEISDMGLPKDMFVILWDPQEIFSVSKAACTLHTDRIFQMLEGMDPEEERMAKKMIVQRLRAIVDHLASDIGLTEEDLDTEEDVDEDL